MAITGIHTGDGHIDSDTHGALNTQTGMSKAWESHLRAMKSAVDAAIANQVGFFLHAGDAFKHGRPSQEAVMLLVEVLLPLTKAGIPIILLDGNHERLLVPTTQRTATAVVAYMLSRHGEVHVVEREPRLVRLSSGVQFACLPWLSKTSILTRLGETDLDPVAGDLLVVDYGLRALDAMYAEADTTAPLITASHVTVDDVRLDSIKAGHKRGSEVDIAHLFAEPILPRAALEDGPASYVALSHIHARQRMGSKCFYAGSPDRFTLTDADDPKSVNLVTINDDNTLARVEHIDTDARHMHSIDLLAPDAEDRLDALAEGALVGLVLPPGEAVVPDSVVATIRDAGAFIIERKTSPVDRPRSTAVTLPEKINPVAALDSWLAEKQPDADREFVVAVASRLVEEVGATQ